MPKTELDFKRIMALVAHDLSMELRRTYGSDQVFTAVLSIGQIEIIVQLHAELSEWHIRQLIPEIPEKWKELQLLGSIWDEVAKVDDDAREDVVRIRLVNGLRFRLADWSPVLSRYIRAMAYTQERLRAMEHNNPQNRENANG